MEAKRAALLAAAAALAALPATSWAELLQPIPNASEHLRALEAVDTEAAPARLVETQYVAHHHHHHHRYRRGYVWRYGHWVRVYPAHHHHHHHHHDANNNY